VTTPQIITIFVATIALAVGAWIGSRLIKRLGFKSRPAQSTGRRIILAAVVGAAVVFGVWIGSRGNLADPVMIYLGVAMWLIATFFALRRPKGA
jgi:uncharacterized membrane protein YeaQ/YmgE (transglycosylase-associated protein family)